MLGRIVSGLAGRSVARRVGGRGAGPLGTLVGLALPTVLRRFGPLGMIGVALGGYAFRKLGERYAPPAPEPQSPINPV